MATPASNIRGAHQNEFAFTVSHVPAVNVAATVTRAAPGVGRRIVITGFDAIVANGGTAPTATTAVPSLVSGSTTKWSATFGVQATAGDTVGITKANRWIICGENEAVTLSFAAASGANTYQSVNLEGVIEELK